MKAWPAAEDNCRQLVGRWRSVVMSDERLGGWLLMGDWDNRPTLGFVRLGQSTHTGFFAIGTIALH